jgi:signal transduction histidine kinase
MICYYFEAPTYFFFAPDLPGLLYYSHIPVALMALLVGFFVFFNNRKELLNKLLFLIALCFAAMTLVNLTAWTNIDSRVILFAWSFFGVLQALISILSIYFIYVFIYKKDVSLILKQIFLILLLPVLVLGATPLNLSGFDLAACDAFAYEGVLYNLYYIGLGILAMVWTGLLLIKNYRTADKRTRLQMLLMGIGIEAFLFMFFTIFYLADYLTTIQFVEDSRLELYGFFGMGIFMIMMGILIVRFNTFHVSALAAEALTVALIILTLSQYTYVGSATGVTLATVTLVLTTIVGVILIRSVRKEVKQREEIERLALTLEKANERLKVLDKMKSEFVSIASHQLRSPLTSIRGYASMLIEGTYGQLPAKVKDVVERIAESSHFMSSSIEDYLNVSRIQAGNMKYEYSDFNLKDLASRVADDIRQSAVKKGLLLTFKSDVSKVGIVHADIGKTRQIIDNLINNSLKYTPKGYIEVFVHDDPKLKKIYVDISDSGIGMSPTTLENIFGKFSRAENANSVNVTGTGLGLFIAQKMARDMGGDVTARSEGEGKGSTFTIVMPLQM